MLDKAALAKDLEPTELAEYTYSAIFACQQCQHREPVVLTRNWNITGEEITVDCPFCTDEQTYERVTETTPFLVVCDECGEVHETVESCECLATKVEKRRIELKQTEYEESFDGDKQRRVDAGREKALRWVASNLSEPTKRAIQPVESCDTDEESTTEESEIASISRYC